LTNLYNLRKAGKKKKEAGKVKKALPMEKQWYRILYSS
jgi:hypothetical protein